MVNPRFFLSARRFQPARLGRLLLFVVCAVISHTAAPFSMAAPASSVSSPWQESAWRRSTELLVDDALAGLPADRSVSGDAERRTLAYTRGVLLLNVQPKLQRNVNEARSLLNSVRQASADDEIGLSALYYLARIAQFHADPPAPVEAAALYSDLIKRAPGLPLAQEAVARLAAFYLFEEVPPTEENRRVMEIEGMVARLTLPAARRDAHFVLAAALMQLTGDKEGALRHLLAAEEAGIVRQELAGGTLVRIALLARDLGHREVAIAHYKKFLASFQRDGRAYMLGEQLKTLEMEAPATPAVAPSVPDASPSPVTTPAASPPPAP